MKIHRTALVIFIISIFSFLLTSCASLSEDQTLGASDTYLQMASSKNYQDQDENFTSYESRLPATLNTHEKTILVDPRVHAWGAYDSNGNLIKAGLITAGGKWCPDIKRACKTRAGTFRIQSLGGLHCKSTIYPLPRGGAPMPYCMFFNKNQGLHGTYGNGVVEGNISHGCVRMRVPDAEWLRYNFATVGTKVIVRPY